MGDGRIFLKTRRDASFNKELSNEPNFDRIHLAGQYLQELRKLRIKEEEEEKNEWRKQKMKGI
jgi:hypothetical protein